MIQTDTLQYDVRRALDALSAVSLLLQSLAEAPPDEESLASLRELVQEAIGAARCADAGLAPHGIGCVAVVHLCRQAPRSRALCGAVSGQRPLADSYALSDELSFLRYHPPGERCRACSSLAALHLEAHARMGKRAIEACMDLFGAVSEDDPLPLAARRAWELGRTLREQQVVDQRVAAIREGEVCRD